MNLEVTFSSVPSRRETLSSSFIFSFPPCSWGITKPTPQRSTSERTALAGAAAGFEQLVFEVYPWSFLELKRGKRKSLDLEPGKEKRYVDGYGTGPERDRDRV